MTWLTWLGRARAARQGAEGRARRGRQGVARMGSARLGRTRLGWRGSEQQVRCPLQVLQRNPWLGIRFGCHGAEATTGAVVHATTRVATAVATGSPWATLRLNAKGRSRPPMLSGRDAAGSRSGSVLSVVTDGNDANGGCISPQRFPGQPQTVSMLAMVAESGACAQTRSTAAARRSIAANSASTSPAAQVDVSGPWRASRASISASAAAQMA